jgi:hypothetical protein
MNNIMETNAGTQVRQSDGRGNTGTNKGDTIMRKSHPFIILFVLVAVMAAVGIAVLGCDIFTEKIPMRLAIDDITLEYTWDEVAKLTTGVTGGRFGESIAVSGNNLIIGAPYENSAKGAAYIYHYNGKSWTAYPIITASNGVGGDLFGDSVDIDGDYAIVGASNKASGAGSAYIYHWNGTSWGDEKILTATGGAAGDRFGFSVGISYGKAIVGAYMNDSGTGTVYIFHKNDTEWEINAKVFASDGSSNDTFGYTVSIYNNSAMIGAFQNDENGTDSGACYSFLYTGTYWGDGYIPTHETQKIIANDGSTNDLFVVSLSMYKNQIMCGASGKPAVYYLLFKDNKWSQKMIRPQNIGLTDQFGASVDIYNDISIIGAPLDDEKATDAGAAYLYINKLNGWTFETKLLGSDTLSYDNFGNSVAIRDSFAFIGTYKNNSNNGAVYVFERKQIQN